MQSPILQWFVVFQIFSGHCPQATCPPVPDERYSFRVPNLADCKAIIALNDAKNARCWGAPSEEEVK